MCMRKFDFDYPITRPYPWRFTTLAIVVASTVAYIGLFYFSGLTSNPFFSDEYVPSRDPSWTNRMSLKKSLNRTLGCDPTMLALGGLYRTENGAFAYTVGSIVSGDTRDQFSTLAYDGSVIESCTVDAMTALVDYSILEVVYTIISNCTIAGNIQLTMSTTTPIITGAFTLESDRHKATPDIHMALNITELQHLFERDLNYMVEKTFYLTDLFPLKWMINFSWSSYGLMGAKDTFSSSRGENISSTYESSMDSLPTFKNLAHFLRSAVLLDLGASSRFNILTDIDTMRRELYTTQRNSSFPSELLQDLEVNNILGNLTAYNLPFEEPQQVPFSARYLCHRMWWKTPANLAVDVLVATTSLFMAYWGVLNFSLRYIAKSSSPHRNHCVCPNCTELSNHASTCIDMHELHSTDDGPVYKSVPTRSQSTP
ncbi:hypothetical protein BDV93DRAFT_505403 [Ceratobasidium sp. AG-I]|nr:hypothetical protein BDV93DRAFT_505403 [Ceratobasidium sp. AG-I]